ncbi:MAG: PEGA domain-containing protein, partial [Bacteroidota bacterium]
KEERFESASEALQVLGEKRSDVVHSLRPVNRGVKRALISAVAGITVLVLLIVFGWMRVSEQQPDQQIVQSNSEIPAPSNFDSSVRQEEKSDTTVSHSNVQPLHQSEEMNDKRHSAVIVKDSGKVFFTSMPWAKVYVNNQLIGETPTAKPVILAAGTYTVMFTNPSFEPIVQTITVDARTEMTVNGNFLEHVGYLMCTVTPWAEVYIDEQYKDTTPLSKPIMVSAGKHIVRFKNSAFNDIVKEISIAPKDTILLSITYTK